MKLQVHLAASHEHSALGGVTHRLVVLRVLCVLFSSCAGVNSPPSASPSTKKIDVAQQRYSEGSYTLAEIEVEGLLAGYPDHPEGLYLLLRLKSHHLDRENEEQIRDLAERVKVLFPENAERLAFSESILKELNGRETLRELRQAVKEKDDETIEKILSQLLEEDETPELARLSFQHFSRQEAPTRESRAYRSVERWLETGPEGADARMAAEWKASVDLGFATDPKTSLESHFRLFREGPDKTIQSLPHLLAISRDERVRRHLKTTEIEVGSVEQDGEQARLQLQVKYRSPYYEKDVVKSGLAIMKKSKQGFWLLSSPVYKVAPIQDLEGDPRYTVEIGWVRGLFPKSGLKSEFIEQYEGVGNWQSRFGLTLFYFKKGDFFAGFLYERIFAFWSYSPKYRTREGLGAGNTLGDFREAWYVPTRLELEQYSERHVIFIPLVTEQGGNEVALCVPAFRKEAFRKSGFKAPHIGLLVKWPYDHGRLDHIGPDTIVNGLRISDIPDPR